MTPTRAHIMAFATTASMALPALASEAEAIARLDAVIEHGARNFSEVCMGSASDFSDLRERALAVGFKDVNGRLLFDPAAEVQLVDRGDHCFCKMILGAPEFPRLLVAMVDRLQADYPGAYRPDPAEGGKGYSEIYSRDGKDVRLVLNPEKFEGPQMLAGFVVADGGCVS